MGTIKLCKECKFYRKSWWFSVRGDICTNSKCDEKAFEYKDVVKGEIRKYPIRHISCEKARISTCGRSGALFEAK